MMIKARRGRSLTLVMLVIAFLALALPVITGRAPAAGADPVSTCGFEGLGNVDGTIDCFDQNGNYTGIINRDGTFDALFPAPAVQPQQLDLPSSAISAGEGSSATAAQGAGLAEIDEAAGGSNAFLMGNSLTSAGAGVILAGYSGYMVGTEVSHVGCSLGLSALCKPQMDPTFVPNNDVTVNPNPGWIQAWGGTASWTNVTGQTVAPISGLNTPATEPALGGAQANFLINIAMAKSANLTGSGVYVGVGTCTVVPTTAQLILSGTPSGDGCSAGTWQGNLGSTDPYDWNGGGTVYSANLSWFSNSVMAFVTVGECNTTCTGLISGGHGTTTVFFPKGSSYRPSDGSTDPTREIVATNVCKAGDGTLTNETADTAHFTEATLTGGQLPSIPDPPACPTGTYLYEIKAVIHTIDGSAPDKTLQDQIIPTGIQTWEADYPGCDDGVCKLGLYKILPDGSLDDCWAGVSSPNPDCKGWFQDADKSTDYECTYGPANTSADPVVALSECNVYSPSFDPSKVAQGDPYGDPKTGTDPGGKADPNPDGGPAPLPGQSGSSCWPSGFSAIFNPLEWVLDPIKCALVWAFVPDTSTINDLGATVKTALDSSGVGPWITGIGALFDLSDNTGCQGPEVTFPLSDFQGGSDMQIYPVDACSDPLKSMALISRSLSTIVIVIGGGIACLNAITAAFGYRD